MTIVESHTSVWEVLAGRAPGKPTGPADPGLWRAVSDRLKSTKGPPHKHNKNKENTQTPHHPTNKTHNKDENRNNTKNTQTKPTMNKYPYIFNHPETVSSRTD